MFRCSGVWVFMCLGFRVSGLRFQGFRVREEGEGEISMKPFLDEIVVDEVVRCFG